MITANSAYRVFFFGIGLSIGVLWSPIDWHKSAVSRSVSDVQPIKHLDAQSKNREFLEKILENADADTAKFVGQFKDMTIHIKKHPFDAWASPDGRFVIRLDGNDDETMASDLLYPDSAESHEVRNRHYSFSCGNKKYSCDFGYTIDGSRITDTSFSELSHISGRLIGKSQVVFQVVK